MLGNDSSSLLSEMIKIISILILLLSYSEADKHFKLTNLVCEPSPVYVENATCALKIVARNVAIANMEMDLRGIHRNVSVVLKMFQFYNQFRPFLIDTRFNLCDLVKGSFIPNFYVSTLRRILLKFSNSIQCPMKVGLLYI